MKAAVWIVLILGAAGITFFLLTHRKSAMTPAQDARSLLPPPDPNVFMIRGFDFYVRLRPQERVRMLAAIRNAVGTDGAVYDQASHAVVLWGDFRPPETVLERLSRDFQTEVIWLAFQKQVDAFGYERWHNGSLLRRLTYGCFEKERTWEEVDGMPEPWEAAALFDARELESRLLSERALSPEFRMTEDDVNRLRTVWREHRLEVNSTEPMITGRDVAEAVAAAYGLPGWQ